MCNVKTNINMKKIVILMILVLAIAVGTFAQDNKESKETKKEQKKAVLDGEYAATSAMLDSMQFVLEANMLRDARGNLANVTSNLNFIMVDSSTSVIQIGSNSSLGSNGVGGTTAKGSVSKWKVDKNDKKKSFTVSWTLMSSIGIYDVIIFVSADGTANATLSGITPGRLYFDGTIVPLAKSRVYEGRSL
jgi:uncharacterized protein YdeI (BOF family)